MPSHCTAATYGSRAWIEGRFRDPAATTGRGWGIQWRGLQKHRLRRIARFASPELWGPAPLDVLDVGCAVGDLTRLLHQVNPANRVTGVDLSERAIAFARTATPHVTFKVASLPRLTPIRSHGFDVVVVSEVLYYLRVRERIEAVACVARVLKPGGRLVVATNLGPPPYFSERALLELWEERFEVERREYYHGQFMRCLERPLELVQRGADALAMSGMGFERAVTHRPDGFRARWLARLRSLPAMAAVCRPLGTAAHWVQSSARVASLACGLSRVLWAKGRATNVFLLMKPRGQGAA